MWLIPGDKKTWDVQIFTCCNFKAKMVHTIPYAKFPNGGNWLSRYFIDSCCPNAADIGIVQQMEKLSHLDKSIPFYLFTSDHFGRAIFNSLISTGRHGCRLAHVDEDGSIDNDLGIKILLNCPQVSFSDLALKVRNHMFGLNVEFTPQDMEELPPRIRDKIQPHLSIPKSPPIIESVSEPSPIQIVLPQAGIVLTSNGYSLGFGEIDFPGFFVNVDSAVDNDCFDTAVRALSEKFFYKIRCSYLETLAHRMRNNEFYFLETENCTTFYLDFSEVIPIFQEILGFDINVSTFFQKGLFQHPYYAELMRSISLSTSTFLSWFPKEEYQEYVPHELMTIKRILNFSQFPTRSGNVFDKIHALRILEQTRELYKFRKFSEIITCQNNFEFIGISECVRRGVEFDLKIPEMPELGDSDFYLLILPEVRGLVEYLFSQRRYFLPSICQKKQRIITIVGSFFTDEFVSRFANTPLTYENLADYMYWFVKSNMRVINVAYNPTQDIPVGSMIIVPFSIPYSHQVVKILSQWATVSTRSQIDPFRLASLDFQRLKQQVHIGDYNWIFDQIFITRDVMGNQRTIFSQWTISLPEELTRRLFDNSAQLARKIKFSQKLEPIDGGYQQFFVQNIIVRFTENDKILVPQILSDKGETHLTPNIGEVDLVDVLVNGIAQCYFGLPSYDSFLSEMKRLFRAYLFEGQIESLEILKTNYGFKEVWLSNKKLTIGSAYRNDLVFEFNTYILGELDKPLMVPPIYFDLIQVVFSKDNGQREILIKEEMGKLIQRGYLRDSTLTLSSFDNIFERYQDGYRFRSRIVNNKLIFTVDSFVLSNFTVEFLEPLPSNDQVVKISRPCRFYLLGNCVNGQNCRYIHK